MYSGCMLDTLSWQMQRSGLLTATASAGGAGRGGGRGLGAGTLADLPCSASAISTARSRATARRLGNIVSAEITYANNLDRVETIRSDGRIDGADPGMAALTGRIEVRFADQVLVTQAINGEPCVMAPKAPPPSRGFSRTIVASVCSASQCDQACPGRACITVITHYPFTRAPRTGRALHNDRQHRRARQGVVEAA
jgi:hypothetical protein